MGANLSELGLEADEVRGLVDASSAFVFCDLWIKAEWAGTHGFAVDNAGSDNLLGATPFSTQFTSGVIVSKRSTPTPPPQ